MPGVDVWGRCYADVWRVIPADLAREGGLNFPLGHQRRQGQLDLREVEMTAGTFRRSSWLFFVQPK
jgi:hypothetical protein